MEIGLMSGKQNDDGIKYNKYKSRIGIQKNWMKMNQTQKKYEYNGFICNENMATIPRKYNGKYEKKVSFQRDRERRWFGVICRESTWDTNLKWSL